MRGYGVLDKWYETYGIEFKKMKNDIENNPHLLLKVVDMAKKFGDEKSFVIANSIDHKLFKQKILSRKINHISYGPCTHLMDENCFEFFGDAQNYFIEDNLVVNVYKRLKRQEKLERILYDNIL